MDIYEKVKAHLAKITKIGFLERGARSYPFKRLFYSLAPDDFDSDYIDHAGGEEVVEKRTFYVYPLDPIPEDSAIFNGLNNLLVDVFGGDFKPGEVELACNTSNESEKIVACPATAIFKKEIFRGVLTYKYEITTSTKSSAVNRETPSILQGELITPMMLRIKVVFFPSENRARKALQTREKRFTINP